MSAPNASHKSVPIPMADKAEIGQALNALFEPDDVIELRALHKVRKRTDAGYFDGDHWDKLAEEARRLSAAGAAVYVNLNPIDPQLLSRYCNRIEQHAQATATDANVIRRRWLLLDFDPVRPKDTSATDAQLEAAKVIARRCYEALQAEGWPEPLAAESGNGMHLLYPLDLPNDRASTELIKGALAGLAQRFDTEQVKIDQAVFNAGRIVKLYGTVANKGDHTAIAPWRLSRLTSAPAPGAVVTVEQLQALCPAPAEQPKANGTRYNGHEFSLEEFLDRLGIGYTQDTHEGSERYKLDHCPFNPEHGRGEAAGFRRANGALGFKCQHASCHDKNWHALRTWVDGPPEARKRPKQSEGASSSTDSVDTLDRTSTLKGGSLATQGGSTRVSKKRTDGAPTEDSLALEFAERHKGRLRFDHTIGKWYAWDGTRWHLEYTKLAFEWARQLCREYNRAHKSPTLPKMRTAEAVEKFARSDRKFSVTLELWDTDPWALNTPAGTVDLRTGQMRSHRPGDHITKRTSVAPRKMETPVFNRFMAEITRGDPELQRFLQQIAGYCLTGITREHALFFLYGPGGNGKSTLINALAEIMADYAQASPMETFTASKWDRHPTELAGMHGARMVTASETEEGRAWAESRIKQLTGGDRIRARFMHKDFFEFKPQFKLVFQGNHKPRLCNVDEAARRRIHVIPFLHKPESLDMQLPDKLKAEYPGILHWMIAGCLDWHENGLITAQSVRQETDSYFADQDLFGQWLAECTTKASPTTGETSAALYECWQRWAKQNGENAGSNTSFGEQMRKAGYQPVENPPWARGKRGYRSIRLNAEPEDRKPYAD